MRCRLFGTLLTTLSLALVAVFPASPLEAADRGRARSTAQAVMAAAVFAVCPGTKLSKLDADLHIAIETPPRNAPTLDLLFSGSFRPEVVNPGEKIFKKKFKGTFAADLECGDGSAMKVSKVTSSSLGGEENHHIIFPVEVDLSACPTPITGWATFDAKGGKVDKNIEGDKVPLLFSFCALAVDEGVGIIPSSFSCSIVHPLADQC
jgi:hypothetical protein